jgi:hypothetical protein
MEVEMHAELTTRRRVLLLTYRRYLEADRAWEMALEEVNRWLPATHSHAIFSIGNPGSPVRQLYLRRERALHHLEVAHLKLETARQRLAARQRTIHALQAVIARLSVTADHS